jgi:hypothetical protein
MTMWMRFSDLQEGNVLIVTPFHSLLSLFFLHRQMSIRFTLVWTDDEQGRSSILMRDESEAEASSVIQE